MRDISLINGRPFFLGKGTLGTWRTQSRDSTDPRSVNQPTKQTVGVAECMWTEHLNSAAIGKVCVRCQGQNGIREIRPSGIAGGPGETWPWLNWEPTPQPKGRGWKPSA